MKPSSYCLFETALGTCGIAWVEPQQPGFLPAVTRFQFPETATVSTKSRMARGSGAREAEVPPPVIAKLIDRVTRHLQGEVQDFRDVSVDLDGVSPFARQVYEAAREIPPGQTRTYGEIAKALGQPNAAQEVGQALAKNPVGLIIPCHRVSAAGGKLGGFSAPGGRATKSKLLALEGAPVNLPLFS